MRVIAVCLFVLVTLVVISEAAGKKKRTELEFVFEDIVSPATVAAAVRSRTHLNTYNDPSKGPVVPEPPNSTKIVTSPFNAALSAATATVINSGQFDQIFNTGTNSLPRPDTSKCAPYPANPSGVLLQVLNTRTIRFAYFDAPPFASTTSNGPVGFDISLAQAVAAHIGNYYHVQLNVTFAHINVGASTFLADVANGLAVSYDAVLTVTNTVARQQTLQFACPYNVADFQFVRGKRDSSLTFTDVDSMNSPDVIVATLPKGNSVGDEARRLLPLATFLPNIQSTADVANALSSGAAHVGFDIGTAIRSYGFDLIQIPASVFSAPAYFALASAKLP